jgi:hypothetical protein
VWSVRSWLRAGIVALGLSANGAVRAATPTDPVELTREILAADQDRDVRRYTLLRTRVSHPQRLSVGSGLLWTRQPVTYDCTTVCEMRGLALEVEPGVNGVQISAGFAVAAAETRGHERFLARVYRAYGVRGAVLRTWGDADLDPAEQTLAGVEGQFTVIGVSFSLGLFKRLGSSAPEPWSVTGGLGWGF